MCVCMGGGLRYQPPFCGGCTNQFQISWLFPNTSLLHLVKSFFSFFVISTKKLPSKKIFTLKNNNFFMKMVKNIFFSQILAFFVSIMYSNLPNNRVGPIKENNIWILFSFSLGKFTKSHHSVSGTFEIESRNSTIVITLVCKVCLLASTSSDI